MPAIACDIIAEVEGAVRGGSPARRVQILRQVAGLFISNAARLDERQIGIFDDVLLCMLEQVEARALAQLSIMLAECALSRREKQPAALPATRRQMLPPLILRNSKFPLGDRSHQDGRRLQPAASPGDRKPHQARRSADGCAAEAGRRGCLPGARRQSAGHGFPMPAIRHWLATCRARRRDRGFPRALGPISRPRCCANCSRKSPPGADQTRGIWRCPRRAARCRMPSSASRPKRTQQATRTGRLFRSQVQSCLRSARRASWPTRP